MWVQFHKILVTNGRFSCKRNFSQLVMTEFQIIWNKAGRLSVCRYCKLKNETWLRKKRYVWEVSMTEAFSIIFRISFINEYWNYKLWFCTKVKFTRSIILINQFKYRSFAHIWSTTQTQMSWCSILRSDFHWNMKKF